MKLNLFRRKPKPKPPLNLAWPLQIVLDDLAEVAGVALPEMTAEIFVGYTSRVDWANEVVRRIRGC